MMNDGDRDRGAEGANLLTPSTESLSNNSSPVRLPRHITSGCS
jgi:hypothetical protein